jgi:hypothetical protein
VDTGCLLMMWKSDWALFSRCNDVNEMYDRAFRKVGALSLDGMDSEGWPAS